jgi:hypothetical protein
LGAKHNFNLTGYFQFKICHYKINIKIPNPFKYI